MIETSVTQSRIPDMSAVFPEELPAFLIDVFSSEKNIILDCFMGSGTTGIAAEKQNRFWLGFEIDPNICYKAMALVLLEILYLRHLISRACFSYLEKNLDTFIDLITSYLS